MFKDLTGMKFGKLTVLRRVENDKFNHVCWECQCDCPEHKIIIVPGIRLKSGETKSCGCLKSELLSQRGNNLVGKIFGRLTVIRRVNPFIPGKPFEPIRYECECSCENHTRVIVNGSDLTTGHTRSCGCFRKERISQLKKKWLTDNEQNLSDRFDDMKKRCYNPNCWAYARYGGRGIYICDEWLNDRSQFIRWALDNGFYPELTLDRINNDGPYAPWNCRWVTMKEQTNNRNSNHIIQIDGESHNISEWAAICGVTDCAMRYYVDKGLKQFEEFVLTKLGKL